MSTKTINDYTPAVSLDATNDYFLIEQSGVYKRTNRSVMLGITGSPVGTTDIQAVTNKTLGNTNTVTIKDTLFTLQDDGDTTKQARFQLSGITTSTTRIYTLPNATVTLASLTGTETLTNKTITSPTINGGTIDNATVTVDAVAGHSASTTGTIYGIAVTSAKMSGASITNTTLPYTALDNGSSWAWTSWTPTYTSLTVGSGVHQSYYTQIGKTVIARLGFAMGAGSAMGGNPGFTLPVTSKSTYTLGENIGGMRYVANSTGYIGYVQWTSTTTATLLSIGVSGADTTISSVVPNTWGTAGTIYGTIIYEAG